MSILERGFFTDPKNWSFQKGAHADFSIKAVLMLHLPPITQMELLRGDSYAEPEHAFLGALHGILAEIASISDLKKDATLAKSRVSNITAALDRFGKMLGMTEASTPEQIITALETHLMRQALGLPRNPEKK